MIWFLTGPLLYVAAAVFAVAGALRLLALVRLPRHLRWELYPIPRLGRAGSKYQQVDFATRPRHGSRWREIGFMAQEILALKKVLAGRRDLWLGSWLLHAGLYLGIIFLGLLGAGAACVLWQQADGLGPGLLRGATVVAGAGAACAGLAGAAYLFALRLIDRGLRDMSDPITYFNLLLLAALFGTGVWSWLTDPGFDAARSHVASLLCGRPAVVPSAPLALALVLTGLFAAYLPFSRMFHGPVKYFFYHAILWDEAPMRPGSPMEQDVAGLLSQRVTWSAAHVRPNASWREQVADDDREEGTTHGP
jgi:nitrate reductase gamma subunit